MKAAIVGTGFQIVMCSLALVLKASWPIIILLVLSAYIMCAILVQMKTNPGIEDSEESNPRIEGLQAVNPGIGSSEINTQGGILLPGWWCTKCDIFNGESKEKHVICRKCEHPKLDIQGVQS